MDHDSENKYWNVIWDKFRRGDRDAFEIIYSEFVDVLFLYGSKITADRELLKDAIHDLFIDLYKCNINIKNPSSIEYYLLKSLKHLVLKKLKERNRFRSSDIEEYNFDLSFAIEDLGDELQLKEQNIQLLQKEISSLDSKKRELLFLKFNSGLKYVEIGKLLDLKPETVKKQVYRLLSHLRKTVGIHHIELLLVCYRA